MLLGMIIYFIYVQQAPGIDWLYTVPIVGGPFVAILFIQLADGYSVPALRAVNLHLGRIFAAWTLLFAIFTIVAFLAKIGDNYSRVWIGTWYLAGLAAFTFIRIVLSRLLGARISEKASSAYFYPTTAGTHSLSIVARRRTIRPDAADRSRGVNGRQPKRRRRLCQKTTTLSQVGRIPIRG